MAAAPQWAEVARGVLAIAQVVALVLGAAWAYFKFVRGRTFAERIEVSVDAAPFQAGKTVALRIRACMTNTGAAIVQLDDDVKVVYVYGAAVATAAPGLRVDWGEHLVLTSVFTEHKWIEAQETVSDEVLVTVPDRRLAYRLELIVASKKNKRWGSTAIVPAPDIEEGRKYMQAQERVEQDDLNPEEKEKIRQDQEEQNRREQEEQERREREQANQPTP